MKLKNAILLMLVLILVSCQNKNETISTKKEENDIVKVMSYNIRLDTASDKENAWPNRKGFLTSQVLFLEPDVFGVQEALPNQIQDLNNALSQYKSIGEGRDGDNKGEHSSIYYNSEKIKVEQYDTFWLSPTPDTVSKGWDAALPRICTYGLFTKLDSNLKFWFFNTHFDHVGDIAKKESIKLILKKIATKNSNNYPVVLVGDFNVEPSSAVFQEATKTLSDAMESAELKFGPIGTFNGFNYTAPVTRRIDYIFVSKSQNLKVKKYAVLSSAVDFKFPSDHFPVYAELKFD